MTDTEPKYPLSDAELLTATGDGLWEDWRRRPGSDGDARAAQRDAIVRAATAKVRAEYDGVDPLYRIECEEAWKALGTGRTSLEVGALAREIVRLRAQLATARTDGAREALQYVFRQFDLRPAVDKNVALAVVECALRERGAAPAPREEAVTLTGEWKELRWRRWVYADASGKVLAEVQIGDHTVSAWLCGNPRGTALGDYLTEAQAKAAVEAALLARVAGREP